jgi:hypothetical protein
MAHKFDIVVGIPEFPLAIPYNLLDIIFHYN